MNNYGHLQRNADWTTRMNAVTERSKKGWGTIKIIELPTRQINWNTNHLPTFAKELIVWYTQEFRWASSIAHTCNSILNKSDCKPKTSCTLEFQINKYVQAIEKWRTK